MYSVSNSISGIIMVIMIISFRTKAPTVGSAGNKKIVSSVRDKNNSHGDWREDIFYN